MRPCGKSKGQGNGKDVDVCLRWVSEGLVARVFLESERNPTASPTYCQLLSLVQTAMHIGWEKGYQKGRMDGQGSGKGIGDGKGKLGKDFKGTDTKGKDAKGKDSKGKGGA